MLRVFKQSTACHARDEWPRSEALQYPQRSPAVLALPEVKLGVIPGTGGTQRLPRLIGIQKALGYMLPGKNIYAHSAKKIGLVDELVHKDALEEAAIKAVLKIADKGPHQRKDKRSLVEKLLEGNPIGRSIIFSQARKKTMGQTKGNYPAPLYIIDSVEFGYKNGKKKGLEHEAVLFGKAGVNFIFMAGFSP